MIRRVQQLHTNGCWVAAFAMLLGVRYATIEKLLFPRLAVVGKPGLVDPIMRISKALDLLKGLDARVKVSGPKKIRALRKPTILIIRWDTCPRLSHAVVWDPETQRIVDPHYRFPRSVKCYQSQLVATLQLASS